MASDSDTYLDGLAGRPPHALAPGEPSAMPTAHAEGEQLRAALLDIAAQDANDAAVPDWADVLAREAANDAASRVVDKASKVDATGLLGPGRSPSPNMASRRLALAAALVAVALALPWLWPLMSADGQGEATQLRGGPAPGAGETTAVWRSAQPDLDGQALAQSLRSVGARVSVAIEADGTRVLLIEADADKVGLVNAELASLDTALGTTGRLTLRVTPAN